MKRKLIALILGLALLAGGALLPAHAAQAKQPLLPEAVTYGPLNALQAVHLLLQDAVGDAADIAALPLGTLFSQRGFYIVLDKVVTRLIQTLLTGIETAIPPARARESLKRYTSENFLPGYGTFAYKEGKFRLGYDSRSILPEDFGEKGYRMGGYDFNKLSNTTYDDLRVRTVVIDDSTGRGAAAFAVLDVIGFANADVRLVRAKLRDLVEDGTLASINVNTTHTHSAIDSQGLWGNDLLRLIPNNIASAYLPWLAEPMQGIDQTFLHTILDQAADSIRAAAQRMEPGALYFAKRDIRGYLSDAIDPYIMDENLYRLRFAPENAQSKPTVIASFGAHPERVGMITGDNPGNVVSADFIPYMEEVVNQQGGANFLYLQGAIGTRIGAGGSNDGFALNRLESTMRYGMKMGYILLGMDRSEAQCAALYAQQYGKDQAAGIGENYRLWYKDWQPAQEEKVRPVLNIAHREVLLEFKNPVLKAAGKMWLADNKIVMDYRTGRAYTLTEVGYLELGSSFKALLQPGETSPELLVGGSNLTAAGSVSGKDYPLKPLRDYVPDLAVLDLSNDSVGYIIPDSDVSNLLLRYIDGALTNEGSVNANLNDSLLLNASPHAASTLETAFLELVESVK